MPSLTPPHKLEEMDPQSGVLSKVGPIDKQRAPVLSNTKRDDAKCEVEDGSTPVESYSVFTETAKRTIVGLCTISGLFSPFSAFTYFPALEVMAQDLGVSLQLMNLTITTYLIIQGIAPTILGDLADQIGRRPVYILVLLLFFVANLGLALQRSFAALLVLRMLQSAGSSGTIALGVMVAADLAPPHERGRYVSAMLFGPNFGQALGPVLGGILAYYAGWPWIFWLLAIMGALCFVLQLIFFPETCRNIVGNGSLEGGRLNKPLFPLLSPLNTEHQITDLVGSKEEGVKTSTRKARIPNPLNSLKLIFRRHNALVLVANALFYLSYSCFQAALSPLIMRIYGLNALQSGLCYVPYGISSILSSYITGKVLDLDYRQTALRHGFAINTSGGDDIATYPIEEARIRSVIAYIIFGVVATIAFGWIIAAKVHLSVPLIITVVLAFSYTGTLNMCMTLNVDLYPNESGTASTAMSLTKCISAAVGLVALQPLLDSVGPGWTFTLLGLTAGLSLPVLLILRVYGLQWRSPFSSTGSAQAGSIVG